MRGHAVELTRPFAEGTEAFRNAGNIDNYIEIFRKIFLPPEESELANVTTGYHWKDPIGSLILIPRW